MTKMKMNRRLTIMLLLSVFIWAFLFRLLLLTKNKMVPPSADIGLYATYVNLILERGFSFPTWDPYHMAGEPMVRPLGFHYLAALISAMFRVDPVWAVLYTGTFFSSLTPIAMYFLAKRLTGSDGLALLCTGLSSINYLDIEILSWGGYPNIAGLALLPLAFYFSLGTSKRSKVAAALLTSTLALIDHSSFFTYLATLGVYAMFLLLRKGFREALTFATPILVGIAITAPWLIFYGGRIYVYTLTAKLRPEMWYNINAEKEAILSFIYRNTVIMPFLVIGVPISLRSKGKSFLLLWAVPSLIMVLFYFVGLYLTYGRLIYFLNQPIMILVSLGLSAPLTYTKKLLTYPHIFTKRTRLLHAFTHIKGSLERYGQKLGFLGAHRGTVKVVLASIYITTIFTLQLARPELGFLQVSEGLASYYQIIGQGEYEALKWIMNNTDKKDIFVSNHTLGWWIMGYAKRPCISYIPPVYINIPWQIQNSSNAYKILNLQNDYASLIKKYGIKYVVLYFNETWGIKPKRLGTIVQRFQNNGHFKQVFNNTNVFIFEVNQEARLAKLHESIPWKIMRDVGNYTLNFISQNAYINLNKRGKHYQDLRP